MRIYFLNKGTDDDQGLVDVLSSVSIRWTEIIIKGKASWTDAADRRSRRTGEQNEMALSVEFAHEWHYSGLVFQSFDKTNGMRTACP